MSAWCFPYLKSAFLVVVKNGKPSLVFVKKVMPENGHPSLRKWQVDLLGGQVKRQLWQTQAVGAKPQVNFQVFMGKGLPAGITLTVRVLWVYSKIISVARRIDFIATSDDKRNFIQSDYALGAEEKTIIENKSFALFGDSSLKNIVHHDIRNIISSTFYWTARLSNTCWR